MGKKMKAGRKKFKNQGQAMWMEGGGGCLCLSPHKIGWKKLITYPKKEKDTQQQGER